MRAESMVEDYKRALLTTFFVQKRIIYFATAVIFLSAVLVSFLWPKTYAAYGSILVKGKKSDKSPNALEKEEIRPNPVTKEDLNSESEILVSPDVIRGTIAKMREKNQYKDSHSILSSVVAMLKSAKGTGKEKAIEESEIYKIKKSVTTEIIPATNVIKITLNDNDPKYAVLLLNSLMEQFLAYRSEIYNPEAARTFFIDQVTDSRKSIEGKEDQLLDLSKEGLGVMPVKEIENNLSLKKDLEQDLHYLKQNAMEKKRMIEYIDNALKSKEINYFSFIEGNEAITNLSKNLQELVADGGPIVTRYNKDTEKVNLFNEQVNNMYNSLKREVQGYVNNIKRQLETINDKIDSVERRIDKIQAEDVKLEKTLIDAERLKRDIEIYKVSYDTFSKRKEESSVSSAAASGNFLISIMGKAFPSSGPIFPIPGLLIPIGLIAGAMTGMSLGFLKEYMDQTFKSPEDVVKYAQIPVLVFIPFMPDTVNAQSGKGTSASALSANANASKVPFDQTISDMFTTLKSNIRVFTSWVSSSRTVYVRAIVLLCLIVTVIGCQVARAYSSEIKRMAASADAEISNLTASASAEISNLTAIAAAKVSTLMASAINRLPINISISIVPPSSSPVAQNVNSAQTQVMQPAAAPVVAPAASAPVVTAMPQEAANTATRTSAASSSPLPEAEKVSDAQVPGSPVVVSHEVLPSVEVKFDVANLRSVPSPRANVVAYPKKGDIMTVLNGDKRGWLRVKTTDGTEGWISELAVGAKTETAGL
ncbi:SH3 domain-containing protein [Candidatus Magnetominusculus dajiuhuensis]|uniref:SH3 domain-containing protein n=1 Tax=Candidatus Magnetominusculus dajiuhuensis TaxID=3137712 RepID=UPI003B437767